MRMRIVLLGLLCWSTMSAVAVGQVSIGFSISVFPSLVAVPGYPVYYAPSLDSNYFFTSVRLISQ